MFSGIRLMFSPREILLCAISACFLHGSASPVFRIRCEDLAMPDWTIERLGNVAIDAWPWRCLEKDLNTDLDKAISRSCPNLCDAVARGFLGFVQYYVEKKGSRLVDDCASNGTVPLDLAIANGTLDMAKYVAEREVVQSNVRDTALHRAARAGKLEAVRFLVERLNYGVDIRNKLNCSPSHYAVEGNQLAVLKYLLEEKGANVNARSSSGCSLLHVAAELGHLDIVEYLVDERGISVDVRGRFCDTPLFAAVWGKQLDTVKYLIQVRRVNVTQRGVQNFTLLHVAAVGGDLELMKYLVDEAEMLSLIDELDMYNYTAAMRAAVSAHVEVLKFLVDERHADVATFYSDGNRFMTNLMASVQKRPQLMHVVEYIAAVIMRAASEPQTSQKTIDG